MTIWAMSRELYISNPTHGLPVSQLVDGDWLVVSSDNEVQLIHDADGVAGGSAPAGWSHQASTTGAPLPWWWGSTVFHATLPVTGYWRVRVTGVPAKWNAAALDPAGILWAGIAASSPHAPHSFEHVGGTQEVFTGTHTRAVYESRVLAPNNKPQPLDANEIVTETWPKGPITVGLYAMAMDLTSVATNPTPPASMRVHLDRLDGRATGEPHLFEYRKGAWVAVPDAWPAPGAPFNQGAMAHGHGWVWSGTEWKPLGRNAAVWTGAGGWVSP